MSEQGVKTSGPLAQKLFVDNIIGAIGDGVMVIDGSGSIALVNPALCGILGYRAEELLGRGWGELFLEEPENLDFSQTVVEVIQTRQVHYNSQVSYQAPDGSRKQLIATTSLIHENDDILGVVAVFKDITELTTLHRRQQELLEQARRLYEQKQEGLDRIARAVAHEVRNPVMAIGGLASRLLKDKEPQSREATYLRRILESTARLEQVVSEVQAYANLPRPQWVQVEMRAWLDGILAEYRSRARDQGVDMELACSEQAQTLMDPKLMGEAIRRILDNSLEAMPQGGTLRIKLLPEERRQVLMIEDTGRGIQPEDLPFIFDPFYTTKADAVGMSLAMAKRIVDEHHGSLEIASLPGHGTTVTIILPSARAHPDAQEAASEAGLPPLA